MPQPPFKMPRRGGQAKAADLQRLAGLVQSHDGARYAVGIGGGLGVQQSGAGFNYVNNAYKPFWAKITGSSGAAYAWTEQAQETAGTFVDYPLGRAGTTSMGMAYEASGSTTVPTNSIVQMWLGYTGTGGEYYLFREIAGSSAVVPQSRTISTTTPLAGGGDLSANRTLTLAGLSSLGTANYLVGVNSGATAWEYKLLAGTAPALVSGTTVSLARPGCFGLRYTITNSAPASAGQVYYDPLGPTLQVEITDADGDSNSTLLALMLSEKWLVVIADVGVAAGDYSILRIASGSVIGSYYSLTCTAILDVGTVGSQVGSTAALTFFPPVSGTAGGDLTGTYPNPTLASDAVETAAIQNDAVTFAKFQNVTGPTLLGKTTSGAGDAAEVSPTDTSGGGVPAFNDTANTLGWVQSTSAGFLTTTGLVVSWSTALQIGASELVFNEAGADLDLRCEGDNSSSLFKLDAGLDAVEITPTTTRASAAGATLNSVNVKAATITVTGSTAITTATGFNLVTFNAPTITDSSACAITAAATVYISGPPSVGGSATIASPYALWVDDGTVRCDGNVTVGDTLSSVTLNITGSAGIATLTLTNPLGVAYGGTAGTTGFPYVRLEDQKSSGTNGGTFTSGADQTRTLNTEVDDADGICSLASNQFTLSAGTYLIRASAPAQFCDLHVAWLYNATAAAAVSGLRGTAERDSTALGKAAVTRSWIEGRFTVAASQALEIRHRCTTTRATDGFGIATSLGTEVYTRVELWKVA